MKQVGTAMMIPFLLGVPPIVGWFIGDWIDSKLGTNPYAMIILLVIGMVAGFLEVFRVIKEFGEQ